MCGIIAGVLADGDASVAGEMVTSLSLLQHRGQDSAGVVLCRRNTFYQVKDKGMVRDVFRDDLLKSISTSLRGNMGIGHVRYPTAGSSSSAEAQPFYVNSPHGIALAHNGNLTNGAELLKYLAYKAHRHINTSSDSEMLLNMFADALQKDSKGSIDKENIFNAVESVCTKCHGGYATVALIAGYGVLAFRDPWGIRPLVYGQRVSEHGIDYLAGSESVALSHLNYSSITNVQPGEAVLFTDGKVFKKQCGARMGYSPCIFEYVYFARPDSVIDGICVYQARLSMGAALAKKIMRDYAHLDIDVVIPVPDTSRVAALECSYGLKKVYREGFIKNRYVGRTFIMPGQVERKNSVRCKLNAMPTEFAGKNVLLVDDSIVRGTTSSEIISMAREVGAKRVYFASAAPALRFQNVYGIDMPSRHELVAYERTDEEIAARIGADAVIYQDLDDLIAACLKNKAVTSFETSVFDGHYKTGNITAEYLDDLENLRNDSSKSERETDWMKKEVVVPGLHNMSV